MGKILLVIVTAVVLVLGISGVALAATPWEIYQDYAADGDLDGNYTDAELQAYLNDPLVDQYGVPSIVAELDALVTRLLTDDQDEFPMTGAQLALIGIGALALVGVGLGLRRLSRSRA
jgi:hypothetical protein